MLILALFLASEYCRYTINNTLYQYAIFKCKELIAPLTFYYALYFATTIVGIGLIADVILKALW